MWILAFFVGLGLGWWVASRKIARDASRAVRAKAARENVAREAEADIQKAWEEFQETYVATRESLSSFTKSAVALWSYVAQCAIGVVASGREPLASTLFYSHRDVIESFCDERQLGVEPPNSEELQKLHALEYALEAEGYEPVSPIYEELLADSRRMREELSENWKKAAEAVAFERNRAAATELIRALTLEALELKRELDEGKHQRRLEPFFTGSLPLRSHWHDVKAWVSDLDEVRRIGELRRSSEPV